MSDNEGNDLQPAHKAQKKRNRHAFQPGIIPLTKSAMAMRTVARETATGRAPPVSGSSARSTGPHSSDGAEISRVYDLACYPSPSTGQGAFIKQHAQLFHVHMLLGRL